MAKNENFSIMRYANHQIGLTFGDNSEVLIDAREMLKKEEFEAIKSEILKMGIFFSEKIEKIVRKELNYPHDHAV